MKSIAQILLTFLLIVATLRAADVDSLIPVEVIESDGNEAATFSYALRDAIRASHTFKLVSSTSKCLCLHVNAGDISAAQGLVTVSVACTYKLSPNGIELYMGHSLDTVGKNHLDETVTSTLASAEKLWTVANAKPTTSQPAKP